jgi:hypothetical protein
MQWVGIVAVGHGPVEDDDIDVQAASTHCRVRSHGPHQAHADVPEISSTRLCIGEPVVGTESPHEHDGRDRGRWRSPLAGRPDQDDDAAVAPFAMPLPRTGGGNRAILSRRVRDRGIGIRRPPSRTERSRRIRRAAVAGGAGRPTLPDGTRRCKNRAPPAWRMACAGRSRTCHVVDVAERNAEGPDLPGSGWIDHAGAGAVSDVEQVPTPASSSSHRRVFSRSTHWTKNAALWPAAQRGVHRRMRYQMEERRVARTGRTHDAVRRSHPVPGAGGEVAPRWPRFSGTEHGQPIDRQAGP